MTIRNKVKDHLKKHGGVELVAPTIAPKSDDPLRFWTNHPTENTLVDLHVFADGEYENSNPSGGSIWSGPFSGRPELIAELASALQARLTLASLGTCTGYKNSLRLFWRVFDQLESTSTRIGGAVDRLTSVRNLTHLHEAAAHRAAAMDAQRFGTFVNIANDARRTMHLRPLVWTRPSELRPSRQLIPDDQSKAVKISIKRDWERVRKAWARNDEILRAEEPDTLSEPAELRRNWLHLERIQKATGRILPTTDQLCEGWSRKTLLNRGLAISTMRAIAFPTREEVDIAFHMALAGSGWNPSTLVAGIDATQPERVFQHPKDEKQTVLMIDAPGDEGEETEEVTMQGSKRRAGGRLQFCMGLKKNPDSPPNIVAAFLERTKKLREQLRHDLNDAHAELARLKAIKAPQADLERQFKLLQTLQQGLKNVWLYVNNSGKVSWIDGKRWAVYTPNENSKNRKHLGYLDHVINWLNVQRIARGEPPIARIVPSDFRDIFARWVHIQTGGNIIAVMFALGHASLRSTNPYLDNNIFNAENDETVRSFMTHLFQELEQGRVDLTILAQLVRHGPLTTEMQACLAEYRCLMRSRVMAGCSDPKNPPPHISPDHIEGKWCSTQRCLRHCQHARFLPESMDGIAMRVEELLAMSDYLPLDAWMRGEFEKELEAGEYLLAELYPQVEVDKARAHWKVKIQSGKHVVPGVGIIRTQEAG